MNPGDAIQRLEGELFELCGACGGSGKGCPGCHGTGLVRHVCDHKKVRPERQEGDDPSTDDETSYA